MLRGFVDRTDRVLDAGRRLHARMPPGSMTRETLTYLHSTVSTKRQRVRVPETPMHLDALLADQPLDRRAGAAAWRSAICAS